MGRFANLEFEEPRKDKAPNPVEKELAPRVEEGRDASYYLAQADQHWRGARYEKALRFYSRALEVDPNVLAGWVGQLRMLVELGEYREARVWADKGLDVHKDNPELLASKAIACLREGEREKAQGFLDLAMQKPGSSPFIWLARGELLLACGSVENADYCFTKARTEGKGDWFVTALSARALARGGHAARALNWAKQALEKEPAQAFVSLVLGDVQAALGLIQPAEVSFRRALSLDRECRPAQEGLQRLGGKSLFARLWSAARGMFQEGAR